MPSSHPSTPVHKLPLALALSAVLTVGAAYFATSPAAQAADASTPVDLKTTSRFAVLAGGGITNTGPTTIRGDIGSFPTTDQTIPGVTLIGANQRGNDLTQQAKIDLVDAYDEAAAAGPPTAVETELGGSRLVAGVYRASTELGLTGTLTLDGGRTDGLPSDAVFIFQTPTTLITEVNSRVLLTGGAQACNVFWQVGSAATFKTGTDFQGTVLAYTEAITAGQGATFQGRLLARTAAVTLNNNTITRPACAAAPDDDDDTDAGADDGGETDGGDTDTDAGDEDTDTDAGDEDADSAPDADGTSGGAPPSSDTDGDSVQPPTSGTDTPRATSSELPSAGGPAGWIVLAGLGAVGAGVAVVARRTRPAHRA